MTATGRGPEAIAAALTAAGLTGRIVSLRDLSGGCIHQVQEVELANGQRVIAKINSVEALKLFEEEAISLRAIEATQAVVVPRVLATLAYGASAVLLMTRIARADNPARHDERAMWRNFGEDLAALHAAPLPPDLARGYGFPIDNHLGSTPQPNSWSDDWVTFNAQHRLGHQLRLARSRDLLSGAETQHFERVISRLDHILPRQPKPSLLHGDLWSGNAIPTSREKGSGPFSVLATCAVIDPASYIGDALADIAMMQLFGGFAQACFDAWAALMRIDLDSEESAARIAVYQLYHALNHVNIFGRGYAAQVMSLTRRLV